MEQQERPGILANGRFYLFTRHFLENKGKGVHLEATDELIIEALSEPDHTQPPEGNRTVYWKKIRESYGEWWLKVVIADEDSGLQVLSAYENSQKGAKLWEM